MGIVNVGGKSGYNVGDLIPAKNLEGTPEYSITDIFSPTELGAPNYTASFLDQYPINIMTNDNHLIVFRYVSNETTTKIRIYVINLETRVSVLKFTISTNMYQLFCCKQLDATTMVIFTYNSGLFFYLGNGVLIQKPNVYTLEHNWSFNDDYTKVLNADEGSSSTNVYMFTIDKVTPNVTLLWNKSLSSGVDGFTNYQGFHMINNRAFGYAWRTADSKWCRIEFNMSTGAIISTTALAAAFSAWLTTNTSNELKPLDYNSNIYVFRSNITDAKYVGISKTTFDVVWQADYNYGTHGASRKSFFNKVLDEVMNFSSGKYYTVINPNDGTVKYIGNHFTGGGYLGDTADLSIIPSTDRYNDNTGKFGVFINKRKLEILVKK